MPDSATEIHPSVPDQAHFVRECIESMGIRISPSSRLGTMIAFVTSTVGRNGRINREHAEFETALECLRDLQLMSFAFRSLGEEIRQDQQVRDVVRRTIQDSVLPQSDRSHSAGRDAQAELYVFAVCHAAGMNPVEFAEPDITCVRGTEKFGIAVKRVKSLDRIENRIRSAGNQIRKCGLPGLIALDTNIALNRSNERISRVIEQEEFSRLYSAAISRFVDAYRARINRWVTGKGVLGVLVHDSQVRQWSEDCWGLDSMAYAICTSFSELEKAQYDLFRFAFGSGLPHLIHIEERSR